MQKNNHAADDKKYYELESLKRKYKHLKAVHQLQNRTVRHFMHNVMSPLSAVSGYLELLINNLDGQQKADKLSRYSKNIGDGLNEIGFLLEQLHDIYKEDTYDGSTSGSGQPVVELNWLVNEVKQIVSNSTELRASSITFIESGEPVFVKAELFQIKLMIYNLIMIADGFSSENGTLEVEVDRDESEFALLIKNSGDIITDRSLKEIFKSREIMRLTDDVEGDSPALLGLKICAQISDQINGRIIMDKRDRKTPQFVLTAPVSDSGSPF
ncbi:sensor histidine kinase [Rhodohalobacter sp. 8-1]|uniref:sensor histidine kinase n=1 Tax=Rhodohalobacter sp. 8-1 TaxID=3131972 RepID=UPI0030ED0E20